MKPYRYLFPSLFVAMTVLLLASFTPLTVVFGQDDQPPGVIPDTPTASTDAVAPDTVDARPFPAITYQGNLKRGGAHNTGICDLRFTLWDAASGGSQIGLTSEKTGVEVNNGLFTTVLLFGTSKQLHRGRPEPLHTNAGEVSRRSGLYHAQSQTIALSCALGTDPATRCGDQRQFHRHRRGHDLRRAEHDEQQCHPRQSHSDRFYRRVG